MIVQPLIEEIARTGEFSLMLFDGEFSHAVVKRPKTGDFRVQPHLGGVDSAVSASARRNRTCEAGAGRGARDRDLRPRRHGP